MNIQDPKQTAVTPTRLIIFQQHNAGAEKIRGITTFGDNLTIKKIFNIDASLPEFIDSPAQYIPEDFDCDVVLSFLNHPDLLDYLIRVCQKKGIPVIASGKKAAGALTPFTCCGLGQKKGLGSYGRRFGFPELSLQLDEYDRVIEVLVIRGASCGATWEAVPQILGLRLDEALTTYGREVQYLCKADPSAFDPITGKSSVHYAGHVHRSALQKAADEAAKK
jgi:hypothetical protein